MLLNVNLKRFIQILTFCLVPGVAGFAQDFESSGRDSVFTSEIVVESNRLKMTKLLAPNKIQVIDRKMITSLNGSRLNDALEFSDALFVKDYGFNSGIKIISLNATQSEHTLVLLDGVRLNSRQNAQVDLSLYDLDNTSRIEISKGGSSALYGSDAIGGVINLITQNPDTKPFGINLKTDFGSYGLRKFYGKLSQSFGHAKTFSYDVSYSDERAENNYDYYFNNGPTESLKQRENSDFNSQVLNFSAGYKHGKSSSWKLLANYSHFERGVPGAEIGYSPGTARQIDYNSITSLIYNTALSKKLGLKSSVNYTYQLQKYFDPSTFNLSIVINSFYKLNTISNVNSLTYTASEKLSIESGTELSFNNITSNETEKGELFQGAVFAAGKYEISTKPVSKISFYPSLRYDYFSNIQQKNVITSKLGVNIKPLEKSDFSIKSSIGNNFRAPTFNELYWKELGNKDLKPEKSISFDAGLFYRVNFITQNEIELSYFNVNTTDRIVWTPVAGIWRPINVGKVKSEGIDASLRSALVSAKSFNASFGFNYTYGTALKKNSDFPNDPTYNKQMIYIPKEMVKASFMFNYLTTSKLLKLVSFNVFYRFASQRYMNFENTVFAPRYDVFDANISFGFKAFKSDFNLKLMVNNIFNEDYEVISGYPMPIRNYKFEINYKY